MIPKIEIMEMSLQLELIIRGIFISNFPWNERAKRHSSLFQQHLPPIGVVGVLYGGHLVKNVKNLKLELKERDAVIGIFICGFMSLTGCRLRSQSAIELDGHAKVVISMRGFQTCPLVLCPFDLFDQVMTARLMEDKAVGLPRARLSRRNCQEVWSSVASSFFAVFCYCCCVLQDTSPC